MKKLSILLAIALLLCGCGSTPRENAALPSGSRRAVSAPALRIFGRDPLAFVDLPFQQGKMEDSAPYVVLNKFFKTDKPYLAFTSDWRCDADAENTYYNVHSWYDAEDDAHNGIKPGSGYTGFQNVNGGHLAILSMWAVPGCEPVVEYAKKGSRIEPFSGEGVGTKVLIPYNWKVGKWQTNKIFVIAYISLQKPPNLDISRLLALLSFLLSCRKPTHISVTLRRFSGKWCSNWCSGCDCFNLIFSAVPARQAL